MCTGISLLSAASDGTIVAARTNEWAGMDQKMGLRLFPRGRRYKSRTPAGEGKSWLGRYGFLSQTAFGQPYGPDGLNEAGLYCGMFMLTGGTGDMSTKPFDEAELGRSLSVGDFMQWALSSFTTVAQVRAKLELPEAERDFVIIDMADPSYATATANAALHFHWKFQDRTNESIILEVVASGAIKIYDARPTQGVVTNSPTYDFQLRNAENYVFLEHEPVTRDQEGALGRRFAFGLPGDFKSPARFVRALHLTRSARPLRGALDVVREAFRILNNFDIPLGAVVPHNEHAPGTLGSTQVTSAADITNSIYYYKTMYNHRIRKIELGSIDWATLNEDISFPMDEVMEEDFLTVSPMCPTPQSRL